LIRRRDFLAGAAALSLAPLRALAAEVKRVRITNVESFRIRLPGDRDPFRVYDYGVSRVSTDAGVTGT